MVRKRCQKLKGTRLLLPWLLWSCALLLNHEIRGPGLHLLKDRKLPVQETRHSSQVQICILRLPLILVGEATLSYSEDNSEKPNPE